MVPWRVGCIWLAESGEGSPSDRRHRTNRSTHVRMGMGTKGGQNMLAQGLHCRAELVKTVESRESNLGSSHFPELSVEATKAAF